MSHYCCGSRFVYSFFPPFTTLLRRLKTFDDSHISPALTLKSDAFDTSICVSWDLIGLNISSAFFTTPLYGKAVQNVSVFVYYYYFF